MAFFISAGVFVRSLLHNRAAIPAICGAAALVPKNGVGKSPAPDTNTPSTAVMSGLVLVRLEGYRMITGPWEEKYSKLPEVFQFDAPVEITLSDAE